MCRMRLCYRMRQACVLDLAGVLTQLHAEALRWPSNESYTFCFNKPCNAADCCPLREEQCKCQC